MNDVDPEGFQRGSATCACGPLYSYGGHIEPGQYNPTCPEHSAPATFRALLAAVRERDNTIARVREVIVEYDALKPEIIPVASTHAWMHEVRAALDPQETP